jgi:hypothetical protein
MQAVLETAGFAAKSSGFTIAQNVLAIEVDNVALQLVDARL